MIQKVIIINHYDFIFLNISLYYSILITIITSCVLSMHPTISVSPLLFLLPSVPSCLACAQIELDRSREEFSSFGLPSN